MSIIDPVSSLETYQTAQSNPAGEIQDSFLLMLVTQLQYQDPLNPMENTEFTTQLAQINTVEQLQEVNQNLLYEQLYMASINNSQALGFVGKEAVAVGSNIYWDGEQQSELRYTLNGNASSVVVNVYDENRSLVTTIQCGEQDQGEHSVSWYGTNSAGDSMPEGSYTFEVMAVDVDGNTVPSTKMITGVVDGLLFEGGITYVTINGQKVPIGEIIEIKHVEEQDDATTIETLTGAIENVGKSAMNMAPFFLM